MENNLSSEKGSTHVGCRICGNLDLNSVLDLGLQPWCNDFRYPSDPPAEKYPLQLVYCSKCGLAQLNYTVKKEVMFSDHTYVSGTTETLAQHFYNLAAENKQQFNLQPDDLIVDIGGNDGTQLLQYAKMGCQNLINVESAQNIAKISLENGIDTICRFFNEDFVHDWLDPELFWYGNSRKAKLINASGVFFHLEELHSVCRGIKQLLDDEGVFVVQFMYLKDIVDNCHFDAIYHEHLCYYTLNSLMNLMAMYDMVLLDAYEHQIHGGSMMAKFVHSSSAKVRTLRAQRAIEQEGTVGIIELEQFAENVKSKKDSIRKYLLDLKKQGKKICGLGSPAKGTTLLTYCGIDNSILDEIYEINPLKFGRITPGTNIPIVEERKDKLEGRYIFVLAWNFADEILEKHKYTKCKFIIPLPEIRIDGKNL